MAAELATHVEQGKILSAPLGPAPSGSKVLRCQSLCRDKLGSSGAAQNLVHIVAGVPWSPTEFIEEAGKVVHPAEGCFGVSDHLQEAVFEVLTKGCSEMHRIRTERLRAWESRAVKLQAKEDELHAAMPLAMRKVLAGKRLLLTKEM